MDKWLIPASAPSGTRDLVLTVPNGDDWEALARGALALLLDTDNYEQTGSITPDDAVSYFIAGLLSTYTDWSTDA